MKEVDKLKDMAENFELPIKDGTWENIVPHIPNYPVKNRKKSVLKYSILFTLILASGIIFTSTESTDQNSVNKSQIHGDSKTTSGLYKSEVPLTNLLKERNSENQNSRISKRKSKTLTSKHETALEVISIIEQTQQISLDESEAYPLINTLPKIKYEPVRQFLNLKFFRMGISKYAPSSSHRYTSDKLERPNIKTKKEYSFISIGTGLFVSKMTIDPSLMNVPLGNGKEFTIEYGKQYKKFKLSIGWQYSFISQSTSMGNHHDTTYYKVFKPGFQTSLPVEYSNRVHDTANLFIPGTSHNTAEQNFRLLGLTVNSGITLYGTDKFNIDINLGVNYRHLSRANTFFYDSVNRVAVPFTQSDKGIVFRHLMSGRISADFNYQLTHRLGIKISPFHDHYFSPFLKHYYKANLRNSGLSLGLIFKL